MNCKILNELRKFLSVGVIELSISTGISAIELGEWFVGETQISKKKEEKIINFFAQKIHTSLTLNENISKFRNNI